MVTEYEYDIEMKTQYGWEIVDCQPTFPEAKASKEVYEMNSFGTYRVKKVPCIVDAAMQLADNER